ncbi:MULTISPECIES: SIR2 family protein [Bacillus]|uniref:SIR2 family NAD-dependent protein deacylase n=1 Tax=Bacillus TaxID=1386 RepID=UPI001F58ACE8|nr:MULTISPECIES: SIR2 family protein [Bacillus cereus group]USL15383.1 SIR2 family protein [Bacillus thuringiensis]
MEIEKLYQEKLDMYPHLKNIRAKLWASEGKSRVSLMVGAGFSLNAEKIEESMEGMAVWNDLKRRLIQDLSHHKDIEEKDVLEIGQIYVKEYGRSSLDEILKKAIPDDNYEPNELHKNLLKLPWTDIYTTNYDTLLERAKKHVYERNYQVVYDISDIPSSVSPRIIKLHGSFPANRPFVFTANDYKEYPKKFSPFVNMVQQSIMETVFVLIGFSGDDPNFERWTTWVSQNLGEHMPKIYMIGYGQKDRKSKLAEKGITLIDFECIYHKYEKPFHQMFTDVFKFFEYQEREEKMKWPHRTYSEFNGNIENLKYNRETYPGWIVMPDEIRRVHAKRICDFGRDFLSNIQEETPESEIFADLNEFLWCYEKFSVPLEYNTHKKIQSLVDKQMESEIDKILYPSILRLLKEARLDCDQKSFEKYKNILEALCLDKEQQHYFTYEQVLYHLNFGDIETVEKLIQEWNVDSKEIEWGIKKAVIIARINGEDKAKKMFEEYLQIIRRLLSIKPDDYRLLSLESIALHNRNRITREWDYGYDRLRYLAGKYCNANKEFDRTVISIKKYEYTFGTKKQRGFDPGTKKSTTSYGDYMKQELLDSYAVLQMQEKYALTINDISQYDLALKNIKLFHSCYSQIKRMARATVKKVDEIFSREDIYALDNHNLDILVCILKNVISHKNKSNMDIDVALEILSRIYLALSLETQKEIDSEVLKFLDSKEIYWEIDTIVLKKLIKRIFYAKNREQSKIFCEKLINTKIKVQSYADKSIYLRRFFEPLLEILDERKDIFNISVSEEQLELLFKYLNNEVDYSLRESALIRLTFLELTRSLSEKYRSQFISNIQKLSKNKKNGISDFIFSITFDKIAYSNELPSKEAQEEFLKKAIPRFNGNGIGMESYFQELTGIFIDYIGSKEKQIPESTVYKHWLEKFYVWWESHKDGLLKNYDAEDLFVGNPDYLKTVIIVLGNNIWGTIPKEYLDVNDKNKAIQIFYEIYERRVDLSLYLIPCLRRLSINIDCSLVDVLNGLWDSDITRVKASVKVLYDYLVFIDKGEIVEDITAIKKELFSMMKYGSREVRKAAFNSIYYIMKNTTAIFDVNDYKIMIQYANNYLQRFKEGHVKVSTRDDFELIASFANLVAYMCKSKVEVVGDSFDDWKDYICTHRLPEVRTHADLFDEIIGV